MIDVSSFISDSGFSELIRTPGANPNKCWDDSERDTGILMVYNNWGEDIGTSSA